MWTMIVVMHNDHNTLSYGDGRGGTPSETTYRTYDTTSMKISIDD